MFSYFFSSIKNGTSIAGRASRTEFVYFNFVCFFLDIVFFLFFFLFYRLLSLLKIVPSWKEFVQFFFYNSSRMYKVSMQRDLFEGMLFFIFLAFILFSLFIIAFIQIAYTTLQVRRLHDLGLSGRWILFVWVASPLFGILFWLYLMLKKGEEGANKFGAVPYSIEVENNTPSIHWVDRLRKMVDFRGKSTGEEYAIYFIASSNLLFMCVPLLYGFSNGGLIRLGYICTSRSPLFIFISMIACAFTLGCILLYLGYWAIQMRRWRDLGHSVFWIIPMQMLIFIPIVGWLINLGLQFYLFFGQGLGRKNKSIKSQ